MSEKDSREKEDNEANIITDDEDSKTEVNFCRRGDEGLKTGLQPDKRRNAHIASNDVESFLIEVEKELIKQVDNHFCKDVKIEEQNEKGEVFTKIVTRKKVLTINQRNSEISNLMKVLSKSSKVVVPTDKTNSFRIIELESYKKWVEEHLEMSAIL